MIYFKFDINKLLSLIKIEEVIKDYIDIKKYGNNYRAISPFNLEKNPSFIVSPTKKIWKDFSSGKGGNVINFLMEYKKINFIEAIKILANKYNFKLNTNNNLNIKKIIIKDKILTYNKIASKFYNNNIIKYFNNDNNIKKYIKYRNITIKMIKLYNIGYADNNNSLLLFFRNKDINNNILFDNTGLFYNRNKRLFDVFYNRIIFPIYNISGDILGFAGRSINNVNKIKYINSKETILYKKRKLLYGIYQAKNSIIKYNLCYIVEGYIDVISMRNIGVHNVISTSGINITQYQIDQIKQLTKNIVIIYDNDNAGNYGIFNNIKLILLNNLELQVVILPNNEDPDSYINKYGKKQFLNLISKKLSLIKFIIRVYFKQIKKEKIYVNKYKIINTIIKLINIIPDTLRRELYIQELCLNYKIDKKIINNYFLKSIKKNKIFDKYKNLNNCKNIINHIELKIILLILYNIIYSKYFLWIMNTTYKYFKINKLSFTNDIYKKIYKYYINIYTNKTYNDKNILKKINKIKKKLYISKKNYILINNILFEFSIIKNKIKLYLLNILDKYNIERINYLIINKIKEIKKIDKNFNKINLIKKIIKLINLKKKIYNNIIK